MLADPASWAQALLAIMTSMRLGASATALDEVGRCPRSFQPPTAMAYWQSMAATSQLRSAATRAGVQPACSASMKHSLQSLLVSAVAAGESLASPYTQ